MMEIEAINESDFSLVELKGDIRLTPHCKKHGAMNKMTKDGFWRCITVSGFRRIVHGNSVSEKHIETICRAGCKEK
jgi:hypothetical protein